MLGLHSQLFLVLHRLRIPVSIAGQYDVIATELYTTMMGAVPDFGRGAVIAMAMLVPSIASVMLLKYVERFNFRYNRINYQPPARNRVRDALFAGYYVIIRRRTAFGLCRDVRGAFR